MMSKQLQTWPRNYSIQSSILALSPHVPLNGQDSEDLDKGRVSRAEGLGPEDLQEQGPLLTCCSWDMSMTYKFIVLSSYICQSLNRKTEITWSIYSKIKLTQEISWWRKIDDGGHESQIRDREIKQRLVSVRELLPSWPRETQGGVITKPRPGGSQHYRKPTLWEVEPHRRYSHCVLERLSMGKKYPGLSLPALQSPGEAFH